MNPSEGDASNAGLLESIQKRSAVVGIIGLGYVGLPLAIQFGKQGFKVVGFDLDTRKTDCLLRGESYIKHVPAEPIRDMIERKQFDASIDFQRLAEADCILICVPTPLTDKMEPDLSYLVDTTQTISENLRPGQLIVLESTTYPGTTEEMMLPRLQTG